jgi:hypothetical protein
MLPYPEKSLSGQGVQSMPGRRPVKDILILNNN